MKETPHLVLEERRLMRAAADYISQGSCPCQVNMSHDHNVQQV